jgi:restriction endonuclease Mrr
VSPLADFYPISILVSENGCSRLSIVDAPSPVGCIMGFGGSVTDAGRALGRSGDDGVEGVIDQDALGLDRVYIQAKRYAHGNNVGSGAIRDFFGSLDRHKASKGLFVTTSAFSPSAVETAQYLSKRIMLIDGEQFFQTHDPLQRRMPR